MPIVIPTPANPLPTPPTTSDPGTFDARADATLLAQQAMVPQLNELAEDTYTNALHAQDRATAAAASATAAAGSATSASTAAAAAQQASAAAAWVSATTYATGNVAWSPLNFQTYRRRTAGAGTTDPSADPTNWEPVTGIKPAVLVISSNTTANKFTLYVITASCTLTLPASPAAGDWVTFSNRSGTATPVIARNGKNIMGRAEDMTVNSPAYFGTLIYADATRGWIFE